jgi:calcium permeable stress-gated cation channel
MSSREIGFVPGEVVWSNLSITWKTRTIRNILTIAAVVATIIFWSIPVAVVGAISNITYITKVVPWLKFIDNCPTVILGVITNLLPVIMLSVLMSLLPPYLRFMAKTSGLPTLSAIELRTQESYFWL